VNIDESSIFSSRNTKEWDKRKTMDALGITVEAHSERYLETAGSCGKIKIKNLRLSQ
jgi:hypothetical protein